MGRWTDRLDATIAGTAEDAPAFISTLGLPPASGREGGRVWLDWDVSPDVFHPGESVFGGYLAALADYMLAFPAWTVLRDDEGLATSGLQITFFRPVPRGRLRIEARIVNQARSMIHVEATFTRGDGKLAAVATATQMVVKDHQLSESAAAGGR